MTLEYLPLGIEYAFRENEVLSLIVENPCAFSEMISSLWRQVNGLDGGFRLINAENELKIEKEVECIINPFCVDANDKKILNALYKELSLQAEEVFQEELLKANSGMVSTLDMLAASSPYDIDFTPNIDINSLLKTYGVRLNNDYDSLFERLENYLKLKKELCGISCCAIVGLKQYLTDEEIKEFYKFLFYEKMFLIDIESREGVNYPEEKRIIVDKDLCIIVVD